MKKQNGQFNYQDLRNPGFGMGNCLLQSQRCLDMKRINGVTIAAIASMHHIFYVFSILRVTIVIMNVANVNALG
ncbi:MAG: hypothetical protein QG657_617 [Acidobacteriota bacterium]|nr:hypothetical protein [Acidobacteriota bacterium]